MLLLTLNKDGYLMIGDHVRVWYAKDKGKDTFTIIVNAPKDMHILRKSLYEETVQDQAATGDLDAQTLAAQLQEEHTHRRQISKQRQAKHLHFKEQRKHKP